MRLVPPLSRLERDPPRAGPDRALTEETTLHVPIRPTEARTSVRGSRYLAWLGAAADAEAAGRALAARESLAPDATHHCRAWRLWHDGRIEAAGFDAGEPAGTAGRPILASLERAEVVQAVCVVSRWFGGVKLGTGGLARSYGEAATAAIHAAAESGALVVVRERAVFRIGFGYPLSGAVGRVVARFEARESGSEYGERVALELAVPAGRADAFRRAIEEATAGGAVVRELGSRLEPA